MKPPTPATLKKYGLTIGEWMTMWHKHNGNCHVCLKPSKRLNIEHEHVKGWKKMPPDERKKYVRGLACYICNNRILTKGVTLERLRNAVKYLEEYESKF